METEACKLWTERLDVGVAEIAALADVHSLMRVNVICEYTGVGVVPKVKTALSLKVMAYVARVNISLLLTVPKVIEDGRVPGVT